MSVTSPPRGPEIEKDRDLEQRVADLELLIEEARRRARRRRARRGVAALVVVSGGVVAFIGFGGHGGGGAGTAGTARGPRSRASSANAESPPLAALPADATVSAFSFDPRNPKIVYVGTGVNNSSKSHVYKSTDAGAHWQLVSGPGWIWLGALASDPKHSGTLYASTSTGIYKTTDGSRTWQAFSRGLLPAAGEGWGRLAVDPNNSNIIYAGLGGGIHKSVDAGHTWQTVLPHQPGRWFTLIAATRPTTIYATSFSKWHRTGRREIHWLGLDSSTDGAKTWQRTRLHVALKINDPYDFAADRSLPTTLYAAAQARIFMSTDAGRSWRSIGHGLPQGSDVTSLAADAGTLYAAFEKDGIYQTTDSGQTWTHSWPQSGTASGLDVSVLAIDPARPTTVYASAYKPSGHTGTHILRSTDSGHTWATAP
jgi:photosystem II stability/assembly factor-like uncharacterized protein